MPVDFHWQEGEQREFLVPPPGPRGRGLRRAILVAGGLLVVALVVGGAILWKRAQSGRRAARADLQAVVDSEVNALQQGDVEVYLSLQDFNNRQWYRHQELYLDAIQRLAPEETDAPLVELRIADLDLRDDRAWVEVQYELQGLPYHRVQFYRLVGGHWRRTAPDELYWGDEREVQTEHLRLLTNEREETLVRSVAEALEPLVVQMLSDFGLPIPGPLVTFEFQRTAEAGPASYSDARFPMPSPLLLGVRADGQPDENLLASLTQYVALLLAIEKSGLYVREPGPGGSWVMLKGIVSWEVEQRLGLPDLPAQWSIWLQEAASSDALPPIASLWPPYDFPTERDSAIAFAQAQSVVGYAVELRGFDALPDLLQAVGDKRSAEESILAATGLDLAQFEAGWSQFVQQAAAPEAGARRLASRIWAYAVPDAASAGWQPEQEVTVFHWMATDTIALQSPRVIALVSDCASPAGDPAQPCLRHATFRCEGSVCNIAGLSPHTLGAPYEPAGLERGVGPW